jgi:cell division cycle protein 37
MEILITRPLDIVSHHSLLLFFHTLQMEKANQRIKMLERDMLKIERRKLDSVEDDDDDDDDDLDDTEAIKIELEELKEANRQRQKQLDDYEKNKKWNVDNMFQVKEERTEVNKEAAKTSYTKAGYIQSSIDGEKARQEFEKKMKKEPKKDDDDDDKKPEASSSPKPAESTATAKTTTISSAKPAPKPTVGPSKPTKKPETDPTEVESDPNFVYTYHEFTEKYADLCEEFMALKTFEESKEFLLKHGDILLQEHAANYLLLATLEDEMNGLHEEMKQRAKQSQIVTNIAELAKSWNTHPGNVIIPFFGRLQQREFLEGYLAGVKVFEDKIRARAVVKRKEIDEQRQAEAGATVQKEGVDLADIPKEERLGPGGLDPLEVIESLPKVLQDAFESRDVDQLREALLSMDPKDAEYHMNRCIASGLWNAGG